MSKRFLVLIALLLLGFYIAGCSEGDNSNSVTNPNPNVFAPTGSISGVVFDGCTNKPVTGAVVSVAYAGKVHQVTTTSNGAFSFAAVPANYMWQAANNGYDGGWEWEQGSDDGYFVTCDLTKVSGYGFALVEEVFVYFGDLGDGDNFWLGMNDHQTEGGSGKDTPVDGLSAGLEFQVAALNASISGSIFDVSTGRAVTGASVSLFLGDNLVSTPVTVGADGAYTFDNVMPIDDDMYNGYSLLVTKAGYEYADLQADVVDGIECGRIYLDCVPGCSQDLAGIDVNLIANPAKDVTVPYIVSLASSGLPDLIDQDVMEDKIHTDVTSFVFTFSEAMQGDRTLDNVVALSSSFTVLVTSGGTHTGAGLKPAPTSITTDIISDYEVTLTSCGVNPGVLTVGDIAYVSSVTLAERANAAAVTTWDTAAATVAYGAGSYTINFLHSAFPGNAHLTDCALNPWYIGTPGVEDHGFLHAFGEAYQDNFIFTSPGHEVELFLDAE